MNYEIVTKLQFFFKLYFIEDMQTMHKNEKQKIYLQNKHKKVEKTIHRSLSPSLNFTFNSEISHENYLMSNMEISSKYRLRLQKDCWQLNALQEYKPQKN